jgi:hypothetical protein
LIVILGSCCAGLQPTITVDNATATNEGITFAIWLSFLFFTQSNQVNS